MDSQLPNRLKQAADIGAYIETNKQLAAISQIHAAIFMFKIQEWECAVTLAGAAEGLLPVSDEPHLFKLLRGSDLAKEVDLNHFINWLKHPIEPNENIVSELEVVMVVVRAISKFYAIFRQGSPVMREFVLMAFQKGHLPWPGDIAPA